MDEFISCPYNHTHRVLKSRLQAHLIKCEKTGPKLSVCPFNATHRLPDSEIKVHCQLCPDRLILEDEKPPASNYGAIVPPKPILQRDYLPESDPNHECWDD